MAKELRPRNEDIACDICGRSILKGERIEPYLAPGGQRHVVCELCTDRAYNEGWIREAAHDEMPATLRRPDQRRGLFGRLRRRRGAELPPEVEEEEAVMYEENGAAAESQAEQPIPEAPPEPAPEPWAPPPRQRRRDARHVRAVPTNPRVKVERALELFNPSEHARRIAGIPRTLGEPWV